MCEPAAHRGPRSPAGWSAGTIRAACPRPVGPVREHAQGTSGSAPRSGNRSSRAAAGRPHISAVGQPLRARPTSPAICRPVPRRAELRATWISSPLRTGCACAVSRSFGLATARPRCPSRGPGRRSRNRRRGARPFRIPEQSCSYRVSATICAGRKAATRGAVDQPDTGYHFGILAIVLRFPASAIEPLLGSLAGRRHRE